MQKLRPKLSADVLPHLVSAFTPPGAIPNATLELVLILHEQNIPTREFAEYLALVDRLYGRLSPKGLMSYSRNKQGRLLIQQIHHSQLEIIFSAWYQVQQALPFVVIMLFLRTLPNLIRSSSEAIKNIVEAYKTYEEGRLTRLKRQAIEQAIIKEASFSKLTEAERTQLIELLESLFQAEQNNLAGPAVFAQRQVQDVILRLKGSSLYPFQSVDENDRYMEEREKPKALPKPRSSSRQRRKSLKPKG